MTLRLTGPLLLVGAGKMGGALLEGWLARGLDPKQIFVRDPAPPLAVAARIAKRRIGAAPILPDPPSVVVLAVKPQLVDEVLAGIGPLTGKSLRVRRSPISRVLCRRARPSSAPCRTRRFR